MAKGKRSPKTNVLDDPKDEFLSRFVKDDKDEIKGESIGVEGNNIVIKNADTFMIVPLASLTLEDNILRVTKKINWESAKKKGEKWKKKELDPL
jgi:hypothetical protein